VSFATASELEVYSGGAIADTTRANALLGYATAVIQRFTGQILESGMTTATFQLPGDRVLILPQRPVRAVTTVTVDGTAITDYVWERIGTLLRDRYRRPWAFSTSVVVAYDFGYLSAEPEYQALKAICLDVAVRAWALAKEPRFDEIGQSVSEAAGFAPESFLSVGEQRLLFDLGSVVVG
jgi:hypothetical protein